MADKQAVFLNSVSELSQVWGSFAHLAGDTSKPFWGDQGNERNPIIDAETLLCLLLPEAYVERLKTQRDGLVIQVSSPAIGSILARLMPKKNQAGGVQTRQLLDGAVDRILELFADYFSHHGGDTPSFAAGSYLSFAKPDAEHLAGGDEDAIRKNVEVVDVYTYSLTVSLLVLMLLERWSPMSDTRKKKVEVIRRYASARLTGAMQGLVDSFVVTEGQGSASWEDKTKRAWPGSESQGLKEVWDYLSRQQGVSIGNLDSAAFEVGWSWGPLSPEERFGGRANRESERAERIYAVRAPYLYFTVGAIDGIQDLFSNDAQASNIFDDRQLALAATLRTYVTLARKYWAGLCRSGSGDVWPIEDMPWRTADGNPSEYWTLYLLRIVLPDTGTTEHDAGRFIGVLKELAQRARITRRPVPEDSDPALLLHAPGVALELEYAASENAQTMKPMWQVYDFSPQLLKACGQLLEITTEPGERASLANLIHAVWEHVVSRRRSRDKGLWDDLTVVYPQMPDVRLRPNKFAPVDSWYLTERVVEALVAVIGGEISRPSDPSSVVLFLNELVSDLDWRLSCLESNPDESPGDLKEQRNTVHEARLALSQGNPTDALKRLLPLLSRQDPRRDNDK